MKRTTILLVGVLLLSCMGLCLAQNDAGGPPAMDPAHMGPGMWAGGGMPGLMGNPGMGPGMNPGMMWPMIVMRLGLSDNQQRRLLAVFLDFAKTQALVNGQIQADTISIAQMMLSDNPDKAKVEAAVREINKLQGQQMLAGVNAMFAAKDILTPDQWHTLQTMIPMMLAGGGPHGMDGHMGPGMAPGMGPGMNPGMPQAPGR